MRKIDWYIVYCSLTLGLFFKKIGIIYISKYKNISQNFLNINKTLVGYIQWLPRKEIISKKLAKGSFTREDRQLAKSYRTIWLLLIWNNVLENFLIMSLRPVFSKASNPQQCENTKCRETRDVRLRMCSDVEEKKENYVMLLLFDISDSFDTIW